MGEDLWVWTGEWQFDLLKSVIDVRVRPSDQKKVQMSWTINATRALIYHCSIDKLRMLRIGDWLLNSAQAHKNRLMEIDLKARTDEGKDVQARINDR